MKAQQLTTSWARKFRASKHTDVLTLSHSKEQAVEILDFVLKRESAPSDTITPTQLRRFEALALRRETGEPVAYITGTCDFAGLKFRVDPRAFIPRATTELLVDCAVKRLRPRKNAIAVDVACGAGAVALVMASRCGGAAVWGTDISSGAIQVARLNAKRLNLTNAQFKVGDLLKPLGSRLEGAVDVMTMHPPYVPRGEVKLLPNEIKKFEPAVSLTDNSIDGMRLISRIISESPRYLKPRGWLLMEIHPADARRVEALMRKAAFTDIARTKGELPYTRVISARKGAS